MSEQEKFNSIMDALKSKAAEILPKGRGSRSTDQEQEAMAALTLTGTFMC